MDTSQTQSILNTSAEERLGLTRATMHVLDGWELSAQQMLELLGLADEVRSRHLHKYRESLAFPENEETWARVDHILHIAEALMTTFPTNPAMGSRWLRNPHRRFRKMAPLQLILEKGREGLSRVRMELDCCYAWERTGSTRS